MTPFSTEIMEAWGRVWGRQLYLVEIISLETRPDIVAICSASLLKVSLNSSWKKLLQTKDLQFLDLSLNIVLSGHYLSITLKQL